MRLTSILLLIVFASFLVAPAIINLSGKNADVSTYFSMNEEENSSKSIKLFAEFDFEKKSSNFQALLFLKKKHQFIPCFQNKYGSVYLEVVLPPPRQV